MPQSAVIGVDIGTSSSKGILVALDGTVLHTAVRQHAVDRPAPGHVEMPGEVWWDEFVSLARELTSAQDTDVVAVGVSGMGPCVLLTDADDTPLRPAILYGVDTRSVDQIERLERELGADEIVRRCGSRLTSQAAGAKVAWVADEEPELFARARRLYMPSSWLARKLTDAYVLDHHSASQCTPLYDTLARDWYAPWAERIAPGIELPPLRWSGEAAGTVTAETARATGLPAGIPVTTGTVDAWAEALSVGAHGVGDLMLMYGTTMFLVHTVPDLLRDPALWSTVGALPDTRNLAGGMATSGAVTGWLRDLFGDVDYPELLGLAEKSGPGANGLLMLPYFAGERTPSTTRALVVSSPASPSATHAATCTARPWRPPPSVCGTTSRRWKPRAATSAASSPSAAARRGGCGPRSSPTSPAARRRCGRPPSEPPTEERCSPRSLSRTTPASTTGTPSPNASPRAPR